MFASSHAPLIVRGWKDVKPANQQSIMRSLTELGRRIKAARPDVLVEISPDHWVNFFINNLPSICIGVGDMHVGPAEPWMKDCPFKTISGHPALASLGVEAPCAQDTALPVTERARRCGEATHRFLEQYRRSPVSGPQTSEETDL